MLQTGKNINARLTPTPIRVQMENTFTDFQIMAFLSSLSGINLGIHLPSGFHRPNRAIPHMPFQAVPASVMPVQTGRNNQYRSPLGCWVTYNQITSASATNNEMTTNVQRAILS